MGTKTRIFGVGIGLLMGGLALPSWARAATYEGVVEAFRDVALSAQVSGNVTELRVAEGDAVASGQVLVKIDAQAQELEKARCERVLAKTKFDYEGLQNLLTDNMISRDEAFEAQIEMEIAEIKFHQAVLDLERRKISTPLDGVVTRLTVEVGEWVEPGMAVAQVLDLSHLFVVLLVPAEQAGKVTLGMSAELQFPADPDLAETGVVDFIDPRVDPSSGFQRIKVLLANPEHRIRPGIRCLATFPKLES